MRDGKNLQNFLICIEMLGASFGMVIAFPYTEYKTAGGPPCPQPWQTLQAFRSWIP